MSTWNGGVLSLALVGGMVFGVVLDGPAWAEMETGRAQPALDQAIEQYLRSHPEVIEDALISLKVERQEPQNLLTKQAITEHATQLLQDPDSPVSGNVSGDVTVVEFFDYRCGYCKRVARSVTQLQQEDSGVRVVYKDFPILGEVSVLASRAALAAQLQGKHQVFHEALLAAEQDLTKELIFSIAERVGVDRQRLEADMLLPKWDDLLERNRTLASALSISGTPGFIVGGELQPGAIGLDGLKQLVVKVRGK